MGWFTSYGSSENRDTGEKQTDVYFGEKGDKDHGHIAISEDGDFLYGRESDGTPISGDQVK